MESIEELSDLEKKQRSILSFIILIEKLKIQFKEIIIELNELNEYLENIKKTIKC
jgi:hypothetical protein